MQNPYAMHSFLTLPTSKITHTNSRRPKKILISDPTLRDGNHAIRHQLTLNQIEAYALSAEKARIDILEVGHGNGLGASSSLLGHAQASDIEMLEAARKHCRNTKLGIHFIPGLGKNADLDIA